MLRTSLGEIPIRLKLSEDKTEGIVKYDVDNAYPQRIERAINGSGTAKRCRTTFSKFITGKGFEDTDFGKSNVNEKQTANKLLRTLSKDYAAYKGFAILVEYDIMFGVTSLTHIPFEFVRFGKKDDKGFSGKMKVYHDWAREQSKKIKKELIQEIDVYNPDHEIIQAQIEAAENFEDYKGQIFYWSEEGEGNYPLSTFDAVMDDMLSEQEGAAYRYENVSTKFLANHMLFVDPEESSEEDEDNPASVELDENLRQFQGGRRASKIMVVEKSANESEFALQKVDITKDDNLFDWTEQASTTKIREQIGIAPILIGKEITGSLGDGKEIENAYKYFNKITTDDRIIMSEVFEELVSRFTNPINTTGNYNIMPLDPDIDRQVAPDEEKPELLVEVIGVGGTTALVGILSNPELSEGQKINAVQLIFGLDIDKATALVNGSKLPEDG